MFADRYIQTNIVYPELIKSEVPASLEMIVMIPCLNEPEVIRTLESLWSCNPVASSCEVIVAVNNSAQSSPEIKDFNGKTFQELLDWKSRNDRPDLTLQPIYAADVSAKHAGAGMARKIGMDEAIRRFAALNHPNGIIVSLDADCLVSANYLSEIERAFKDKSCFAATINFRHRFEEIEDVRQQNGIRLYEDYLHYYKNALDYAGFPNSIYTIGSAFAVRVDAYVKQGGMNRRQAGEDFYFLHKLTQLGRLTEIQDAYVFPSGRVSDRVPFGTGAAMTKWMNDAGDLTLTYNFAAFSDLKQFFARVDSFYTLSPEKIETVTSDLPTSIQEYLSGISFQAKLDEINRNSSTAETFYKRFFQFFDGLMILRFLNQVHERNYKFQKLAEAIAQLKVAGESRNFAEQ
ncbi:MAG: glycosyltransferase family 2 protein [Prolixibacteraceae bacterium]|jgi:hypothetical protein